jgi:hypothetical protein
MKKILVIIFYTGIIACYQKAYMPKSYRGAPWQHKKQGIPGRVECEFYDEGGEGVAYHDADSVNNGSGKLNPANGEYLNEFRKGEGVDISFTKPRGIDDNPYSQVPPVLKQLYVGWTQAGEWLNYTLQVHKTGKYRMGIMYTANGDGAILLNIDGNPATLALTIPSTHNDKDTVAWRQWHHWNKIDSLTTVSLTKGAHLLTLLVAAHGNMNFDYLEFKREQ